MKDAPGIQPGPTLSRPACQVTRQLGGADQVRLRHSSAERLSFEGRRPARVTLVLVPVVTALAVVPWLAPAPMTWQRLLTTFVLGAAAFLLLRVGWPRRHRIELLPAAGRLVVNGVSRPFVGAPRWALEVYPEPLDRQGCRYAAVLELGGERWSLLLGPAPDRVLADLGRVLGVWPAPVASGWGLPEHVRPWDFVPSARRNDDERADAAPQLIYGPRFGATTGLAGVLVLITVTVIADMVFLVSSGAAGLSYIHPLSIALPSVMVFGLVCLTVWISSARNAFVVGHSVVLATASLLFNAARASVRTEAVRGVHVVGAEGSRHRHLLIESDDGPLALLVHTRDARALAQRLSHAIGSERATPRPSYAAALPELAPSQRENSVSR
jgi:hypothetical protein